MAKVSHSNPDLDDVLYEDHEQCNQCKEQVHIKEIKNGFCASCHEFNYGGDSYTLDKKEHGTW